MNDIDDITARMQGTHLRPYIDGDTNERMQEASLNPDKQKLNYIKSNLLQYPNLKLNPIKIYNSSAILKNDTWAEFIKSVHAFLENKNIEYTASQSRRSRRLPQSGHSSRLPQSGHSSRLPQSRPVASTSVEPGIHKGGKKSRRNTRRRKNSKKQKPPRKQTRRHRHRHRRSRHRR
jgi:hypothetical protein